ncbi:MAG: LysR substrate-binding domain-containing protein [Proteobacteria bacterium]|nr:LysR substrate-binding domain-containing protein [Pseudomonadota bacterium]
MSPVDPLDPINPHRSGSEFERLLLSRMNLRQMQTLVTVAEQRNILKASELLNMTQPAVSKSIKEMENTLGLSLFIRTTRGVSVTEYGASFIDHVRAVLAEMRAAWNELADIQDAYVGKLQIGALPSVSGGPLIQVLADLPRDRPGISITIHEGVHAQLLPALRNGELDMVVGRMIEDGGRGGLGQTILYHEPWAVLARKEHPLSGKNEALDLSDVFEEQWILPLPNASFRPVIKSIFDDHGLALPSAAIECSSGLMARSLLMRTDMLMIMPRYFLGPEEDSGGLAPLNINLKTPAMPVSIMVRDSRTPTAVEELVREKLFKAVAELGLDRAIK